MEQRSLHQKRTEPTFNELIDRLKICSEINHPNRPWSEETKVNIAFEWINKYDELKVRVETLEAKILKELSMIRANELRIGNLVRFKDENFNVWDINNSSNPRRNQYFISLDSTVIDKHLKGIDFNEITPIPLTDVWLLKCGGDVRAFATGILIDRFRFIWKEVYSYWYVLDAHNQTYLTKIEFVHELQNFYFAMNGQELNITG